MPMNDMVIYCPCKYHEKEKHRKRPDGSTKTIAPCPRILTIVSSGTFGSISVQCNDSPCVKYNKEQSNDKYNSWYRIEFNGLGAHKIIPIPIPKKHWELNIVPVAIMEDN